MWQFGKLQAITKRTLFFSPGFSTKCAASEQNVYTVAFRRGRVVSTVRKFGGGEVLPENLQIIEPAAAVPIFLITDIFRIRCNGQVAEVGSAEIMATGGQFDQLNVVILLITVITLMILYRVR